MIFHERAGDAIRRKLALEVHRMVKPPRILVVALLVLSAVCAASALGGVALAVRGSNWFMLAFELVVLVNALFVVHAGLGRRPGGEATTALWAGGTVAVAAVLVEPTIATALVQGGVTGSRPGVAGVDLLPLALARFGAGVLMMGLAGLIVLMRRPGRSFRHVGLSLAFAIPLLALGAVVVVPGARQAIVGVPAPFNAMIAIVVFFATIALVSLAAHHAIRAIEIGMDAASPLPARAPTSAKAHAGPATPGNRAHPVPSAHPQHTPARPVGAGSPGAGVVKPASPLAD